MRERPRITNTTRPIVTAKGREILGTKPLIIVYVVATKYHLDDFAFRCRKNGVNVVNLGPFTHNERECLAFEATGTPEGLELLTGYKCVAFWHFALNVRIPWQGAGAGEEKRVPPLWKQRLLDHPDYSRDD